MQMRSAYNASMQQQQRTSNKQSFFYAKHVLFHAIEHRDWHRRNVRSKRIHSFRHLYTFIKKSEVNLNKKKWKAEEGKTMQEREQTAAAERCTRNISNCKWRWQREKSI